MLNWLSNFLTNRTVNVKIEDSLSTTRTINKGVPQGCVLSPILFNIMMADFPLPDPRTNLALFADDILDGRVAQHHINCLPVRVE
jgi:hypothetical protein